MDGFLRMSFAPSTPGMARRSVAERLGEPLGVQLRRVGFDGAIDLGAVPSVFALP